MQAKQTDKDNRMVSHIVSLVLGIISLCTGFFWYIALPTSITAIVLGTKSYKKHGNRRSSFGYESVGKEDKGVYSIAF